MTTLLGAVNPALKGFDFSNSHPGELGATTVRPPTKMPGGHVFLHGVVTDPANATETNTALREITQLMATEAYRQGDHPLHAGAVLQVEALFRFLHPEEED